MLVIARSVLSLKRCIVNTVLLLDRVGCCLLSLTDLVGDVLLLLVDVEESGDFLEIVEVEARESLFQPL